MARRSASVTLVAFATLFTVLALPASEAAATQSVMVEVVDQYGSEIPGSEIRIIGVTDRIVTGSVVGLEPGDYDAHVYPGILGRTGAFQGRLTRFDSFSVDSSTSAVAFEWLTAEVSVEVEDQFGDAIPGSTAVIANSSMPLSTGDSAVLPITDETVYPTMSGSQAGGYDVIIYPGIQGRAGSFQGRLARTEVEEVGPTTDLFTFEWATSDVHLALRDQDGVDIPGSVVIVANSGVWTPTGSVVPLPITDESVYPTMVGTQADGYDLAWLPGIRGIPGSSGGTTRLGRTEVQETTHGSTDASYEWITADVTFRLVDQYGTEIPDSIAGIIYHGWGSQFPTGTTLTLPITDEAVYPSMYGTQSDGYDLTWFVGIQGHPGTSGGSGRLGRTEVQKIHEATSDSTFEWITADVVFRLEDQFGDEIPGSRAYIIYWGWGPMIDTGQAQTLPITDESVYPSMFGSQMDGYDVRWIPGFAGSNGYWLSRLFINEVAEDTPDITGDWWMRSCHIQLVDADGVPVSGSHLNLGPFNPWIAGSEYVFPVNNPWDYPTIAGTYANGYRFSAYPVWPGDPTPVDAQFFIDGSIQPSSFEIDGTLYALSCNQPPTVDAGGPYQVAEGSAVTLTATGNDPEGKPLGYAWDLDADGTFETSGQSVPFSAVTLDGPSQVTVEAKASDGVLEASDLALVDVLNVPPMIQTVTVPSDPVPITDPIPIEATFADPGGPGDGPFMCSVDYGDGSAAVTWYTDTLQCIAADSVYGEPGVYTLEFTVTDKDGDVSATAISPFVVVFDPAGGHVTGGGMIYSPAGAYVPAPEAAGKATFGFVARYHRGADTPTGNTQFVFHAGDLRFHSAGYDWLVVAGAKAMFKGHGEVNGEPGYQFLLSAIDSDISLADAHEVDQFRIKIWDSTTEFVVYDNNLGELPGSTEITSGQIRIQK